MLICRRESMMECSNSVILRKSVISGRHPNGTLDSNDIIQLLPDGENNKYQMGVSIEVDGDSFHDSAAFGESFLDETGSENDGILDEFQDDEFTSFEDAERRNNLFTAPCQLYVKNQSSDEIAETR